MTLYTVYTSLGEVTHYYSGYWRSGWVWGDCIVRYVYTKTDFTHIDSRNYELSNIYTSQCNL